MHTVSTRLDDIDRQAESLASGFRNLEPEALAAVRDYAAYLVHMTNREMAQRPTSVEGMVELHGRASAYAELGETAVALLRARRKPEEGINGPEMED